MLLRRTTVLNVVDRMFVVDRCVLVVRWPSVVFDASLLVRVVVACVTGESVVDVGAWVLVSVFCSFRSRAELFESFGVVVFSLLCSCYRVFLWLGRIVVPRCRWLVRFALAVVAVARLLLASSFGRLVVSAGLMVGLVRWLRRLWVRVLNFVRVVGVVLLWTAKPVFRCLLLQRCTRFVATRILLSTRCDSGGVLVSTRGATGLVGVNLMSMGCELLRRIVFDALNRVMCLFLCVILRMGMTRVTVVTLARWVLRRVPVLPLSVSRMVTRWPSVVMWASFRPRWLILVVTVRLVVLCVRRTRLETWPTALASVRVADRTRDRWILSLGRFVVATRVVLRLVRWVASVLVLFGILQVLVSVVRNVVSALVWVALVLVTWARVRMVSWTICVILLTRMLLFEVRVRGDSRSLCWVNLGATVPVRPAVIILALCEVVASFDRVIESVPDRSTVDHIV